MHVVAHVDWNSFHNCTALDLSTVSFGLFVGTDKWNPKDNNRIGDGDAQLWRDLQTTIFVNAASILQSQETLQSVVTGTPAANMSALALRVVQLTVAINARGVEGLSQLPLEPDQRAIRQPPALVLLRGIVAAWVRKGLRITDTACEIFVEILVLTPLT